VDISYRNYVYDELFIVKVFLTRNASLSLSTWTLRCGRVGIFIDDHAGRADTKGNCSCDMSIYINPG